MSESIYPFDTDATQDDDSRPGALDRIARRALLHRLDGFQHGALVLVENGRTLHFGRSPEPRAVVHVRTPRFYRRLALRGTIGAAESYMDGDWRTDDLTTVVRIVAANQGTFERLDGGLVRIARPGLRLLHTLRHNSRGGSRRNIAAHYDLGNDFFELFLDPTLTYSCAVFERPEASLEAAQVAKYERVCRKLRIGADDHVLEIGSGWGGFALHAARTRGCRVTTTTVSRAQHELARRRIAEAGLADRVDVLLRDYRDLEGTYDKAVSIEMIEAVGAAHLGRFFRVCADRLRPEGAMLLQAITVPDQDWKRSVRNVDFVKRYIFPGGQLMSLGAILDSTARETDLRIAHVEDLTPHYAETLARWRRNLAARREQARALGLPERFLRMWDYYFSYCEGGFRERAIGTYQVLLERAGARRAPVLGRLEDVE
jgi:cyclopropane-fatty-acyl-phospholipid synthase